MPPARTGAPGTLPGGSVVWAWRHPRTRAAEGLCIGHCDAPVDRRKAKRLARRVDRAARAAGLPRVVVTSTLRRSAEVGRWLRRRGWVHRRDPALVEIDFGRWEGRRWSDIGREQVDAWCADFMDHAPGGGESLRALLDRAAAWQATESLVVIGHAGWMLARRWLQDGRPGPATAAEWPRAPGHGELQLLSGQRYPRPDDCGPFASASASPRNWPA